MTLSDGDGVQEQWSVAVRCDLPEMSDSIAGLTLGDGRPTSGSVAREDSPGAHGSSR